MYEINELVKAAYKVFKHSGALVKAALQQTGKTKFTLDEAKNIVENFANRPISKE